jgi:coenzyme F420-dependent glucose-6-phosphate dehydrogenase
VIRLGYKASAEQFAPRELLDYACLAEELGFDSVFVSDHFQRWPEFTARYARLREAIALIRRLWSEERVTFEGEYYRTTKATIYDRPASPVPIYIAAAGPQMAKYAGRVGDGFICTSGKAPELYRESLLPAVAEGIEASGRAAPDYDRMIEMKVSFDTNAARARDDTRHWAALALPAEAKTSVDDPLDMERLASALPIEQAASRWIVSTDPDEHVARIRPYVALGFRHLVVHAPGPDQARFLRLYAREVLPRLRGEFG